MKAYWIACDYIFFFYHWPAMQGLLLQSRSNKVIIFLYYSLIDFQLILIFALTDLY